MKYFGIGLLVFIWLYLACFSGEKMNRNKFVENEVGVESIMNWKFENLKSHVQLVDQGKKQVLVDSFINIKSSQGFPLIEDSLCHFIYLSSHVSSFSVAGDFNRWNPHADSSLQLAGTNLHYITKSFPLDARLDYKIIVDSVWILDPLNTNTIWGGYGPNSEITMPEYERAWEIESNDSVPHGSLVENGIKSEILGCEQPVVVYLPPGYEESTIRYPSLYVNDGRDYLQLGSMANVLNNLRSAKLIEPLIVIFIDPLERMVQYTLNEEYLTMLKRELVPFIDYNYRTLETAEARGILGVSLGGLTSLHAGLQLSDLFGKVAGQSSAVQWDNQKIFHLFQEYPLRDIEIYLDWGTYEGLDSLSNRFVRLLNEKGYSVKYNVYNEGHSWGNWRAHTDEILKTFWGN